MNVRMLRRDSQQVVLVAFGIACLAFGMVEIVNPFLGWPFLAVGGIIAIVGIRRSMQRLRTGLVALALLPLAIAGLGWSSEHLWNGPDCSHAGAISGQRGYWSGATLEWKCVDGRPVIIKDTR
jgi:hypothetical protein